MKFPITFFAESTTTTDPDGDHTVVEIFATIDGPNPALRTEVLYRDAVGEGETVQQCATRILADLFDGDTDNVYRDLTDLRREYDRHTHGGPE